MAIFNYNWINDVLVKKIKWLNDVKKFTQGSKDWRKIKGQYIKIYTASQTCWQRKSDQRKHGIPNDVPNDISNDANIWKNNSSWLYPVITEHQFQAFSKKKLKGHYGQQNKAHHRYQMLASSYYVASQQNSK